MTFSNVGWSIHFNKEGGAVVMKSHHITLQMFPPSLPLPPPISPSPLSLAHSCSLALSLSLSLSLSLPPSLPPSLTYLPYSVWYENGHWQLLGVQSINSERASWKILVFPPLHFRPDPDWQSLSPCHLMSHHSCQIWCDPVWRRSVRQ